MSNITYPPEPSDQSALQDLLDWANKDGSHFAEANSTIYWNDLVEKINSLMHKENKARIEENQSLLKYAELHMDARAQLVIKNRIDQLNKLSW